MRKDPFLGGPHEKLSTLPLRVCSPDATLPGHLDGRGERRGKRERVGVFKNPGRRWCRRPTDVNAHDFPTDAVAQAIPYGVYDLTENEGWVSVGITHDTAEFAVQSVRRWWQRMGRWAHGDGRCCTQIRIGRTEA